MYIPSKIDMEYLVDAAEKTSVAEYIPRYIPYILFKEAQKTLENQARTDYTADLEDRICKGLSGITDKGIPNCPEDYKKKSAIEVLVYIYGRYSEYFVDEIREEDEKKHRKLEIRSEMRKEDILTASKAMRTALKMLSLVERGDTPQEVFIQENGIPQKFLQDTEYDEEGSREPYRLPAKSLPGAFKKMTLEDLDWDKDTGDSSH